MDVYVSKDVFRKINKLRKKKSYKDIDDAINKEILSKDKTTIEKLSTALITKDENHKLIKKRISANKASGKSSAYRLLLLFITSNDNLYIVHLYPKTGSFGQGAIIKEKIKEKLKEFISAKKDNELLQIMFNKKTSKIEIKEHADIVIEQ